MKQVFINLSLVFISILLVITTGEIFLRAYRPHGIKLLTEHDPLLGWKLKPNARGQHKTEEFCVTEVINSKGLRGPEIDYTKSKGVFRVLLLGDSFVEGYFVDFEKHFSQIMLKKLQSEGIDAEVVCGGVGGYSTDQELLFFANEGKKYHPNITVLMFHDNDVWYNIQPQYWRGDKPLFKLQEGELILTNVPVTRPVISKESRYQSALYKYLEDKFQNRSLSNLLSRDKKPRNTLPDEFKFFGKKYTPDMRYAWEVTEAIIIRLKEKVQANSSEFLVCYIPSRASIYRREWEDTKKRYGISEEEFSEEQIGKELGIICQRNVINYLNLTELLRREARRLEPQGERVYYLRDGHWNVWGNKVVGEYLAHFIRKEYFLFSVLH